MDAFWRTLNVEYLVTQFVAWIPSLISAALLLLGFWILYRVSRPAFAGLLHRIGFDPALATMLLNVYRFTLMAFGVVMAASQLGINVGAALAGLGVVGLTIGFAARDSLSNIMAGFLIFWDKPFRVGHWLTLGSHYGKVAEITMRTTRLQTLNNTWVIIPNQTVINEVLVNHTTGGPTRVQVPVGIAYKEYIPKARRVILEALKKVEGVATDPAPSVVVNALGASSVDLTVHAWILEASQERPVFFRVLEASKLALDDAEIQIPYPHLQLFVDNVEDRVWNRGAELVRAVGNGDLSQ